MSVKIIPKQNKTKLNGMIPLYMRVTINRKTSFFSLGVDIEPDHWDESICRVKKSHPNSKKINHYLREEEYKAAGEELDKNISAKAIKNQLLGKAEVSLSQFIQGYYENLEKKGNIATFKKHKSVLKKMETFLDKKPIQFMDFDLSKLKSFQAHLEGLKNTPATIHSNLRIIRKYYNLAIKEGIIKHTNNPFSKFTMPKETQVERTFLTEDEVNRLIALDLTLHSLEDKYRDIYVLSTFIGLRISDLLQLNWSNFNGSHLLIKTQKTKSQVSLLLPEKALEIILKYKPQQDEPGNNNFIFPCLNNGVHYDAKSLHNSISSQTTLMNRTLKEIGKKAEIAKSITCHSGRHTFATRALSKGIRIEYLSKLLSHRTLRATSIYSHIVNRDLDDAMLAFN